MQQVKYPNLDNFQQSQQIQVDQGLKEQLVDKINENTKFIPIVISPQENIQQQPQPQYQQFSQYQQNQIAPYADYQNHYIVPIPNFENSNFLKDQDFQRKKVFLCSILGIYILWSVLFILLLFPLSLFFFKNIYGGSQNPVPFILLVLFSLILIILAKVGVSTNYRNTGISILILLGLVFCYTVFYLALVSTLSVQSKEQFGWPFIIGLLLYTSIIGNFIFNFILLICLMFSENKLNFFYPILIEILGLVIFGIVYHPFFLLSIFFMLPYSICLMNGFNQIIKGRFQLKKSQVFTGAIAAFYSQIVCCTD